MNKLKSILASALVVGLFMSFSMSSCNNAKKESSDTTEETATDMKEEKGDSEEHPSGEHPSGDEEPSDTTKSEHPEGEHPSN